MKPVERIVSGIVCASIVLLAGCVKLRQENLDVKTYMIEAKRSASALEKPLAEKLWIETVTVLSPCNMRNLVIRESDVEFTASYYAELIIPPAENFRNVFFAWFSESGMFKTVSLGERSGRSHRLAVTVLDFHGDATAMQAVMKIKVSLFDEKKKDSKVLFSKDYDQGAELLEVNAEELVRAYNTALLQILADCEEDVFGVLR